MWEILQTCRLRGEKIMLETIKRTRQIATRYVIELCADGVIGYPVALHRINRIDAEAKNATEALTRYIEACYGTYN